MNIRYDMQYIAILFLPAEVSNLHVELPNYEAPVGCVG